MPSGASHVTLKEASPNVGVPSIPTADVYFSTDFTYTTYSNVNVSSEFAVIQPFTTFNPIAVSTASEDGSDIVVNYMYNSQSYGMVYFATRVPMSILVATG